MDNREDQNQQIFREAAELVERVRSQLEESGRVLDSMGVDPHKMRDVVAAGIEPAQAEQAEADFRQDMAEVQREVDEEMARRSFQNAKPSAAPRPRRTMI